MTSAATFRPSFSIPSGTTFAALRFRAYRTYVAGQSLANIGAWMQSVAQDWLVLRLTGSATAVGATMALQFLPVLFLGVHGGLLADRCPRRPLLLATQSANALLTGALAVLTITGVIRAEHIYLFAFLCGLVFVVDAPTRQVFVAQVVPPQYLQSAISLNGAVFQTTRLVGPAVAGLLIGTVGTGWAFAANALCYLGPTVGLLRLRAGDLIPALPADRQPRPLRTALRHVRERPQVFWTIFLVGVVGMFGLNFPIVLTAMASRTFSAGPGMYGLFNVVLAAGSVAGALLAGSRSVTRLRLIVLAGGLFGVFQALDAAAPDLLGFLALLICMGAANLAFQAMANASVQLRVEPEVRGRVMGLYLLAFMGGTPIGAPIIGALTNHFGARAGMLACGLIPIAACVVIVLIKIGQLRAAEPALRPPAELPGMDLDGGVPVRGQHGARDVRVRGSEQGRGPQPGGGIVGQQRPVRDQAVAVARRVQIGAPSAGLVDAPAVRQAEDQVAVAAAAAAGEVPHAASEGVAPAA